MSALTSLLVRDQVVPVRKIEEAIQRQVIAGGELETVLLEMDAVQEDVVSAYRSATFGLLPATRDEVMKAPREVIRQVPREVAERHRLVPLSVDGRALIVAVASPLKREEDHQLAFLLGKELVFRIVTEVRIASALGHHYEIDVPPRFRRLAEKLRQRDPGVIPYVAPPLPGKLDDSASRRLPPKSDSFDWDDDTSGEHELPREEGGQRDTFVDELAGGPEAPPEVIPAPAPVPAVTPSSAPRSRDTSPIAKKLRGPLPSKAAVEVLKEAGSRDEILDVLFVFARQFFDYTALFVVADEVAEGRDAYGNGASSAVVQNVAVHLTEPSGFKNAKESMAPVAPGLAGTAVDENLSTQLGRQGSQPSIIVPFAIRKRVVVMIYGDRGGEALGPSDVPELVAFVPRVAEAFERLIMRKKKGGAAPAPSSEVRVAKVDLAKIASTPPPAPEAYTPPPRASERPKPARAILLNALGVPRSAPPPPDPSDAARAKATRRSSGATRVKKSEDEGEGPTGAATPALGDPSGETKLATLDAEREALLTRDTEPPPPGTELDHEPSGPTSWPEVTVTEAVDEPTTERATVPARASHAQDAPRRREDSDEPSLKANVDSSAGVYRMHDVSEEVVAPVRPSRLPPAAAPAPKPDPVRGSPIEVVRDSRREDDAPVKPEVVKQRSSRPGKEPPRSEKLEETDAPLRKRNTPSYVADEPKVIVDMGASADELLTELDNARPREVPALVVRAQSGGEAVLAAIAQRFPGPLFVTRLSMDNTMPKGHELSAACAVLVAFGARSLPYVVSLLESKDSDARLAAVLVAQEIVHPDLVAPIVRRILDEDALIRRAALEAARAHKQFAKPLDEALKEVRSMARTLRPETDRRREAVRALATLRDVRSLPIFIELLKANEPSLVECAHEALVVLTRQDFGTAHRKWQTWEEKNAGRSRIEWLVDALMHSEESMRTAAGDELKAITQQYFGYHPAQPKKDREIAQKKYRLWWDSEGRRLFGR